jgi:hypothetical protein
MGDYNAVAYPNVPAGSGADDGDGGGRAIAFWTDSRNGRGSGSPTAPSGRNPACEQADVFLDFFNPLSRGDGRQAARNQELFLVTPCPQEAISKEQGDEDDDD